MREILFRGKRIDNNEWTYGDLIQDGRGYVGMWAQTPSAVNYEVERKTVGQFTGLKDKNGKKVFEGDIVKYIEIDIDGSDDKYIGVIYYNQSTANYVIQKRKYRVNFVTSWIGDVEVVGNIHDDPELLK